MRDAMDARLWADHHHHFSATITAAIRRLKAGFIRLNQIQFDAPWKTQDHKGSCG